MKLMKVLAGCALLLPLAIAASATTGGGEATPAAITVKAGTDGSNGDCSVKNGTEELPDLNGDNKPEKKSPGKARITPGGTENPDSTATTVTCSDRFVGKVSGLETGDKLEVQSSCLVVCEGTGGRVDVSASSHVLVKNTAAAGGASIRVTLPGGSTADVGPGSQTTFHG